MIMTGIIKRYATRSSKIQSQGPKMRAVRKSNHQTKNAGSRLSLSLNILPHQMGSRVLKVARYTVISTPPAAATMPAACRTPVSSASTKIHCEHNRRKESVERALGSANTAAAGWNLRNGDIIPSRYSCACVAFDDASSA